MSGSKDVTRRVFLEGLGAYSLGGATLSQLSNRRAAAQSGVSYRALNPDPPDASPNAAAWTAPPVLTTPNILVILVDQMRWPVWLTSDQMTILNQKILPNIFGKIRNNSYVFAQYYSAATVCTASRGTLLSGLYAPQTAAYIIDQISATSPALNPAFPTWANALQALMPAYQGNVWWFGKWHLSKCTGSAPLQEYGFNTRTYPGGAAGNPAPDGAPNEGTDGGSFQGATFASDKMITDDFVGWMGGSQGPPSSPWCATVSLINPHDIAFAPAWLQSNPFPPLGVPLQPVYFPPPPFPPSGPGAIYASLPSPWNYENLQKVTNKPSLQYAFQAAMNRTYGHVTDWVTFLNQYYWLQYYVDQQVGRILNALKNSGQAGNTVIVFTSDHGEYAGSHGLHNKGYAAYDESIRVPLYVHFPGRTGSTTMNQMCSNVDFFGLICDLATSGGGLWQHGPQAYPDLASRQSIWDFLYRNATETRIAPTLGIPYILHTCDETQATPGVSKGHIVCLRTKVNATNTAQAGAKLVVYSEWAPCTTVPDGTKPDYEFYDYNPATTNNRGEMGNDYFSSNLVTQGTLAQYLSVLGTWGPNASGLIATELNAPLTGTGTDGNPLSQARKTAQQNYFNYMFGPGACTV